MLNTGPLSQYELCYIKGNHGLMFKHDPRVENVGVKICCLKENEGKRMGNNGRMI